MKKILFLFFLFPVFLHSQPASRTGRDSLVHDTAKAWKHGGLFALNFTQSSFTNWASGGSNSVSGQTTLTVFANYKKKVTTWDNGLDLAYGLLYQGTGLMRKTDDKIDFTSKYGRYAFKKVWYYSALAGFKTQFQPGYNYKDDISKTLISGFMSPAYLITAIGLDYKPSEKISLLVSPLTGRTTFVLDQALADSGAFGVKKAQYDLNGNKIANGANIRYEFGSYVRVQYKAEIMKNVTLTYRLELFSNYLKKPQNVDVNTELLLSMKINKHISAGLNMQAIYDDDVIIAVDSNHDGVIDAHGPRLQFRQVLGVGFSAKF
ncbi:MAG: DUF3078 domain-containing protein [Bacteroidetes bacterium]|nr:DUF3078 domain-containing protein [Bacteroidota bacterium]